MTEASESYYITADIGGSKISTAVINDQYQCVNGVSIRPSNSTEEKDVVVNHITDVITATFDTVPHDQDRIKAILMGVPTRLDQRGFLIPCSNLPTLGNFDLRGSMEDHFDIPIFLAPDATCFTAGEYLLRKEDKFKVFCGLTLGTGIGMSVIIDGRLFHGASGKAGEIWKSAYQDELWEHYVSKKFLQDKYLELTGNEESVGHLAVRARTGDKASIEVFREYGHHLGNGLSFVANILDPDGMVLGGSISKAFDLIFPYAQEVLDRHLIEGKTLSIEPSIDPDLAPHRGILWLYQNI